MIQISPTLSIHETSTARIARGEVVYRLGFGQSPFPPPSQLLSALREAAFLHGYAPVQGIPGLRAAIASYLATAYGFTTSHEEIVVGPGSKSLLHLLIGTSKRNLLLPTPAWVSYMPQALSWGLLPEILPVQNTDGSRILRPEQLLAYLSQTPQRARVLLLTYPNNPSSESYSPEELRDFAEIARRHDLWFLADEIYAELDFEGAHRSLAEFCPERVVVTGGLSKWCGIGGWRLGFVAFPKALRPWRDEVIRLASETYSSASLPIQKAAEYAFLHRKELEQYVQSSRLICKSLARWSERTLDDAGIQAPTARGGFYLMANFQLCTQALGARNIYTGSELARRLLEETGVATLSSDAFGCTSKDLSLRLALVDFCGSSALRFLQDEGQKSFRDRVLVEEKALRILCPKVLEAVEAICKWTLHCNF